GEGPEPAGPPPGRAERRRLRRRVQRRRRRALLKEIPLLGGVALLIALLLKTFLFQAFVIPSGSMEQTIRIGDRVIVDKLSPWFGSKPERGDVVVFRDPGGWLGHEEVAALTDESAVTRRIKEGLAFVGVLPSADEQDLIKRVVGVGGDHVMCCDAEGRMTVNGTPLDEDYLHPGDDPSAMPFEVTVPEGTLWVMGDHRSRSADSREHRDGPYGGAVAEDLVVGRAVAVAWPLGHWGRLTAPETFTSVPGPGG
ncbi:signal peptidase I, partial [Streptomyces sp. CO7]